MDIYIIDTSAFMRNSDLLDHLTQCEIVIHTIVLEELDNISKKNNTRGAYARNVGNRLFELKNRGNFMKGIQVDHKIIKFSDIKPDVKTYLYFGLDPNKNDNLLLCAAREIKEKTGERVILLTGDKFFALKSGTDIEVEYIKSAYQKKIRKMKNKGYYNKGQQLASNK